MKKFKRDFKQSNHRGRTGFIGTKAAHKARCNDCASPCTLPFKPNGKKPVLCSDCFRKTKDSFGKTPSHGRLSFQRSSSKPSFGKATAGPSLKQEVAEMNRKLDQILALLGGDATEPQHQAPKDVSGGDGQEPPNWFQY